MGGRIVSIRDRFLVHLVRGQGYVVTDERGKYLTEPLMFRPQVDRVRQQMQAEANANAKIGARLLHLPGIVANGKVPSVNVRGQGTENEQWRKTAGSAGGSGS